MKTFIKRILSMVTAAAVVTASGVWVPKMNGGFTAVTVAAADEEYTYGDFKYKVLEDGTVEITGSTNDGDFGIEPLEIPETIEEKRVTKFSAEIMHAELIIYPTGCESEFTKHFLLEHTTLIKYHTDSGEAVIDEYKLGNSINANIFIPETILGNSVSSVETFSTSDSQYAIDDSIAVFCKDGVTFPDNIDKILVRYDTNGESCKITSVSGSNENAVLGLFDVNGKKITSINGFDATVGGVAVEEQLADSIQANCPVLSCVKRDTWYDQTNSI